MVHADLWLEGETTLDSIIALLGEPMETTAEDKLVWTLAPGASTVSPIPPGCKTMSENGEALLLKR